MMQHSTDSSRQYESSPKTRYFLIIVTILVAFVFNLIPVTGIWLLIRPEFLMMTLIYWVTHRADRIDIMSVLLCGLLMDVATGDIFGQHAFAYLAGMALIVRFRRRLRTYGLGHQLLYVILSLLITHSVLLLTKLIMGYEWIGWSYFLSLASEFITMPFLWLLLKHLNKRQTQHIVNLA